VEPANNADAAKTAQATNAAISVFISHL